MADDSDRVIPATPRRREAARRAGAMPLAALPAWVATAGTAVLLLPAWAAATTTAATELLRAAITTAGRAEADASALLAPLPGVALPTVAVVLAAAAAGLGVRLVLDGLSWHPDRALPSWRRIDPLAGLARIVSGRTLVNAVGAGMGLAVIAAAAAFAIRPLLAVTDPAAAAAAAWRAAATILVAATAVAVVSWLAARRRFEGRIRMTPQEFAEEARSAQADPKIRLLQQQRRRSAQPTAGAA
jgi:flagellar biosynthetic protein FlhB